MKGFKALWLSFMKVVVRHPKTSIQANYRVTLCRCENAVCFGIEKYDKLNGAQTVSRQLSAPSLLTLFAFV